MHPSKRIKLQDCVVDDHKIQRAEYNFGMEHLRLSNGSIVISPSSVLNSSIVSLNTGNCRIKIEADCFQELTHEELQNYSSRFHAFTKKSKKDIHMANRLFLRKVKSDGLNVSYSSDIEPTIVNFDDVTETKQQLNAFAQKATKGAITEIGKDFSFEDCSSIVVNVLSWKWKRTNWKYQPKTMSIEEMDFFLDDGSAKKIPFIKNDSVVRRKYFADDEVEVCTLPHKNPELSLTIILPRNRSDFKNFRETLTGEKIKTLLNSTSTSHLTLTIPKMNFETEWSLTPDLLIRETETPVHSTSAVGQSTEQPTLTTLHKAAIETDEEGTTDEVCGVRHRCVKSLTPPIDFKANHPYIFVVRLNVHCLFIGQFCG